MVKKMIGFKVSPATKARWAAFSQDIKRAAPVIADVTGDALVNALITVGRRYLTEVLAEVAKGSAGEAVTPAA